MSETQLKSGHCVLRVKLKICESHTGRTSQGEAEDEDEEAEEEGTQQRNIRYVFKSYDSN